MVGAEEVGLSFGAFGEDISRERGAKEPHSSIDFVYCTHMCFQLWSRREERDHLYDCTYTRSLPHQVAQHVSASLNPPRPLVENHQASFSRRCFFVNPPRRRSRHIYVACRGDTLRGSVTSHVPAYVRSKFSDIFQDN